MIDVAAERLRDDVAAHNTQTSAFSVFVLTFVMAAMTGLGSIPFFLLPKGEKLAPLYAGLANAIACGVMLAASFDMVH